MPNATLSYPCSYTPAPSIIANNLIPRNFTSFPSISRKAIETSLTCRASSSSTSSPVTDLDLYDLLGIDSTCDQSQIKIAYRRLQKRCHPDIAGPTGHDMSIILNQAYSILSNPASRLAYDEEQAKIAELRGYTGKPMYSVWLGSESEERAVFVDELKCVGCLKCALFADKTFAIESVYGRARVVAQWADPPHQIRAAIDSCPVDCISMVERSNLAALEYLMSKQPRGNVRVGTGNAIGGRASNIFVDVQKFQTRVADAMKKANTQSQKETEVQREARLSAIQAIRSISKWLYWRSPKAREYTSESCINLLRLPQKSTEPNINKLREAAAARKQARQSTRTTAPTPSRIMYHEDYWIPLAGALPVPKNKSASNRVNLEASPTEESEDLNKEINMTTEKPIETVGWGVPMMTGILAAVLAHLQLRDQALGRLDEHIGGSLALDIVNSYWLHVLLAGITWYFICVALIELAEVIRKRL